MLTLDIYDLTRESHGQRCLPRKEVNSELKMKTRLYTEGWENISSTDRHTKLIA